MWDQICKLFDYSNKSSKKQDIQVSWIVGHVYPANSTSNRRVHPIVTESLANH